MSLDDFKGIAANDAQDDNAIPVLAINWNTVQVFLACQWTLLLGMSGSFFQGISAQEIRSAVILLRIPRSEWPLITTNIGAHMVPSAQAHLNRKRD